MAMGKRREDRQGTLFVATDRLPKAAGHPFYEKLYHPFVAQGAPALKTRLECLLFALARAEVDAPDRVQYWYRRKRRQWSNVLAAFLGT